MGLDIFEKIRRTDEGSNEYWLARELAVAIGYKDYRNFKGIIEKAQQLCRNNSAKVEDHFVECTEMVKHRKPCKTLLASRKLRNTYFNRYSVIRKDWIPADNETTHSICLTSTKR